MALERMLGKGVIYKNFTCEVYLYNMYRKIANRIAKGEIANVILSDGQIIDAERCKHIFYQFMMSYKDLDVEFDDEGCIIIQEESPLEEVNEDEYGIQLFTRQSSNETL